MGHTVDNNINNIVNISTDGYKSGLGVSAGSDFVVDKSGKEQSSVNDISTFLKYDKNDKAGVKSNTTMDNFEEYLKNRQEKAKEAGEDQATKERQAKEEAKEISRSLTSDEIKQLKMMGIDVTSAKLSDVMGMVNTMRGEAHRQETRELLANAGLSDGDTSGITMVGGTAKIAGTDIELKDVSVTDFKELANADNVANAPEKSEITLNQTQVNQGEGFNITNNELVYIIKNNLDINKENMYKAHYSGSMAAREGSVSVINDMMPQVEGVIEQAGYEVKADTIKAAQFMLDNQLPVTTDNLKVYMEYQDIAGKNVLDVDLSKVDKYVEKAKELYNNVASIEPAMVYDMVAAGKQVTIASAVAYSRSGAIISDEARNSFKKSTDYQGIENKDIHAVTAMRQMEEIRLSMTMEAAGRLVKSDFNIDTRDLAKLVNQLRTMEEQLLGNRFKEAGVEPTSENISLYKEMQDKIGTLGKSDARIIAAPLKGIDFTVNALYEEKLLSDKETADKPSSKVGGFEAVRRSYEAVGTAPRADMGDSIRKAFANVSDILEEMKLPVNYENERAVRILGYNSMEITETNINQIVSYDRQVNQLMDTFYPEAVLSMIKDGINPLDVPIDELNQIIADKNYNKGVTEAENFATYLRDMEKRGMVSPEERESYIGIYRVMNKLAKSGDREAGWLFNSGMDLTVRNLITAMRSRKATGVDVSVDDSFGMLESVLAKGKDMELQIETGFAKNFDIDDKKLQDDEILMKQVDEASDEVFEYMAEHGIEITAVNVITVQTMLADSSGIYGLVSQLLAKMNFKTDSKSHLIDEETEAMTDSLLGEDVPVEFTTDSILESLRGKEEMSLKYEDLRDRITELMYTAGVTGTITSMDISTIKTVSAGFNIMSHMAKNDRYQVPVSTEEGIKVMNLTIQHDVANRGRIQVAMDGGSYGEITADIRVGENNHMSGYMISSTSEGNFGLLQVTSTILEELTKEGFEAGNISFGTIVDIGENFVPATGDNSGRLYQASVALVKAMGRIL